MTKGKKYIDAIEVIDNKKHYCWGIDSKKWLDIMQVKDKDGMHDIIEDGSEVIIMARFYHSKKEFESLLKNENAVEEFLTNRFNALNVIGTKLTKARNKSGENWLIPSHEAWDEADTIERLQYVFNVDKILNNIILNLEEQIFWHEKGDNLINYMER